MASLATGHELSVLRNLSVTRPVDPSTGLVSSAFERAPQADSSRECEEQLGGSDSEADDLYQDDYYRRLVELKDAHKETLRAWEKLYREKTGAGPQNPRTHNGAHRVSLEINKEQIEAGPDFTFGNAIDESRENGRTVRHMAPLSGQSQKGQAVPARPVSGVERSGRRGWNRSMKREECCSDEEGWENMMDMPTSLKHLWDRFSLSDCRPGEKRVSGSLEDLVQEKEAEQNKWRHRITIPKPFKMTVRGESKEKRVCQSLNDYHQKAMEKEIKEKAECKKKFKAKPIPAHVYLPLYKEFTENNKLKSNLIKRYSKELLKLKEKPFNFTIREEIKKEQERCLSAPPDTKTENQFLFKAKPVPKNLFNSMIDERIHEEEEFRKVYKLMRAEKLLKESSLPPNMKTSGKTKDEKVQAANREKHKPNINHTVPDYDALYQQFQKKSLKQKIVKEPTVVKSFKLHTSQLLSNKKKILKDMQKDEDRLKEIRWPSKKPRSETHGKMSGLCASVDSLPTKTTAAAELRSSVNRSKIKNMSKKEAEEFSQDRRRRTKELQLRKQIHERLSKIAYNQQKAPKKQKLLDHTWERTYRREIEEIYERLAERPLLFEQQQQTSARKQVEKMFDETLRNCGLDEEFISRNSSAKIPSITSLQYSGQLHEDERDKNDDQAVNSYVTNDDEYLESPENSKKNDFEGSDENSNKNDDDYYSESFEEDVNDCNSVEEPEPV